MCEAFVSAGFRILLMTPIRSFLPSSSGAVSDAHHLSEHIKPNVGFESVQSAAQRQSSLAEELFELISHINSFLIKVRKREEESPTDFFPRALPARCLRAAVRHGRCLTARGTGESRSQDF